MIKNITSYAVLYLFALSLTACGSADDTVVDSTEQEARIKPKGLDDGRGRFTLAGIAGISPGTFRLDGRPGTTGEAYDILMGTPTEDLALTVVSTAGALTSYTNVSVALERRKAKTLQLLAGLRVRLGTELKRDFGLRLGTFSRPIEGTPAYTGKDEGFPFTLDPTYQVETGAVFAKPNRTYEVRWGFADGMEFTTGAAATITTANLSNVTGRQRVEFVPPVRELGNACVSSTGNSMRLSAPNVSPYREFYVNISKESLIVGFNPKIFRSETPPKVVYRLPCLSDDVSLTYGALGGAPLQINIGRIDVDHVDVTTASGTVEQREGTYEVLNPKTGLRVTNDERYKTGTGLDVPPGTYKVVVSYQADTGTKTFTEVVTVP
jgi:hypothetical protein